MSAIAAELAMIFLGGIGMVVFALGAFLAAHDAWTQTEVREFLSAIAVCALGALLIFSAVDGLHVL